MGADPFDHGKPRSMTEPEPPRHGVPATLRRWRTPLVLVPALAGITYGGAVGAQMLWAEPDSAPAAEAVVTCWDGTEDVAADCPPPTGRAGLRWVFPSFQPREQRCRRVVYEDAGPMGPLEFACRARTGESRATISYSERSGLERGLEYFAKRYDDVEPERVADGTRIVYRADTPRADGRYEVTVAYAADPFAVTVSARDERLRDTVLEESVQLRPASQLRVRPAAPGEQPGTPAEGS